MCVCVGCSDGREGQLPARLGRWQYWQHRCPSRLRSAASVRLLSCVFTLCMCTPPTPGGLRGVPVLATAVALVLGSCCLKLLYVSLAVLVPLHIYADGANTVDHSYY